jgi:hypothetical protein
VGGGVNLQLFGESMVRTQLTLRDSLVVANTAGYDGGGLYVAVDVTGAVVDSVVAITGVVTTNNTATGAVSDSAQR